MVNDFRVQKKEINRVLVSSLIFSFESWFKPEVER